MDAVEALSAVAVDTAPEVRAAAASGTAALASHIDLGRPAAAGEDPSVALSGLIRDADVLVRAAVLEVLGSLAYPANSSPLPRWCSSTRPGKARAGPRPPLAAPRRTRTTVSPFSPSC
ncbi:hypothetical protein [Streptomyces sp. AC550_RSS872]|uniref:hypothetical protein n=1 Tax=Streptomyces sp. AC550_RSS872 TaxID=2823689 RepID=UPI001C27D7E4|nr:hypothetical protein [Streptomyces sp. AC550_RSS872]